MRASLRTLIDHVSRSAEPDAGLLRTFATTRDPAAFAELVRRYGRLVWGQCRHLLNSEADADDAFQATFFALAKSARNLRDTNKLGPWLQGVAYRVCQQAKRTAARRGKRERESAKAEAARPVADSAWDSAFAAVHDELAKLPDTLRVAFVLCVLEGKGTTAAAEQLGLKLGTLSARLSKAKQQLFERLSARGLTTGLAAVGAVAVGATSVPAAVLSKACDLAAGGVVPANILSLSHGVLGMAAMNAKWWVMAALAAGGLAFGVGGAWTANAQDKPAKEQPAKPTDAQKEELLRLRLLLEDQAARLRDDEAEARRRVREAQQQAEMEVKKAEEAARRAAEDAKRRSAEKERAIEKQPEFRYHGQMPGYAPTPEEFERTVREIEAEGYTFVTVVNMKGMSKKADEAVPTWVFRRTSTSVNATLLPMLQEREKAVQNVGKDRVEQVARLKREKDVQAEIERLTAELAALQKRQAQQPAVPQAQLPLAPLGGGVDGSQFVTQLVRLKFGEKAAGGLSFDTQKDLLVVKGLTAEQAKWLSDAVTDLTGKKPAK